VADLLGLPDVAGTFSGPIGALAPSHGSYEATDGERVVRVLRS
jgi:hypothetical protein